MIHKRIYLWEKEPDENDFKPSMDTYILEGRNVRGAVLICPGGGYRFIAEHEGEPFALKMNAAGFHAFVLNYRISPARHPSPLMDVSKAMCIIRQNAAEWNINDKQIAVCGFSAGGHLAASLGVYWNKPFLQIPPSVEGLNRPDALILCYPVISSGEYKHSGSFENLLGPMASAEILEEMSLEKHVTEKTPPVFLWHTFEDKTVPVDNSLLFAQALRENGVPFEMHIYPTGHHGLSIAGSGCINGADHPHVASWVNLCIEWMKDELHWAL